MKIYVYRYVGFFILISFSLGDVSAQEVEEKKKPKRTGIFELIDKRQRRKDMMVAITRLHAPNPVFGNGIVSVGLIATGSAKNNESEKVDAVWYAGYVH